MEAAELKEHVEKAMKEHEFFDIGGMKNRVHFQAGVCIVGDGTGKLTRHSIMRVLPLTLHAMRCAATMRSCRKIRNFISGWRASWRTPSRRKNSKSGISRNTI